MANEFDPGASTGNPAGFIADAIKRGVGSTASLGDYLEAGGEIRRQTWFRLYGEVSNALARSESAQALDPYQVPDQGQYATWTMGRGGDYATHVKVFFRDRDTGLIGSKDYDYVSPDPHAPAEGEAAAYDEYSDPDAADEYGQQVLGTITTNVFQTIALNP